MLIFDRHNVIYAYGQLDKFASILIESALIETADIRFPDPHSHHYQAKYDDLERLLLQEQSWNLSPLRSGDENPT